jgi:hypothetical protein
MLCASQAVERAIYLAAWPDPLLRSAATIDLNLAKAARSGIIGY